MNSAQSHLVITGSAPCVLEDIAALALDASQADYMAIGLDAVDKYPWSIKYMATYHPAEIPEIYKRREAAIGRVDFVTISHERNQNVGIFISDYWKPSGSSALLGVQAGLLLGYRRIILCGCPLTGQNANKCKYETFRAGWEARKKELGDRVRSMSGWTKEFLGEPTEEWLLAALSIPVGLPNCASSQTGAAVSIGGRI